MNIYVLYPVFNPGDWTNPSSFSSFLSSSFSFSSSFLRTSSSSTPPFSACAHVGAMFELVD